MTKLEQLFTAWIYENHRIGNGDMFIQQLENPVNWDRFLRDAGLPDDTEMDFQEIKMRKARILIACEY